MRLKTTCAAALMAALGMLGCDDGGGTGLAATCPVAFSACGGDAVGTWTWAKWCQSVDVTGFIDGCPDSRVVGTFTPSGTLTIGGDGTYVNEATLTTAATATIPKSCLAAGTCSDLQTSLNEDGRSWVCSDTGAVCTCLEGDEDISTTERGTYTVSGNMMTITPEGETETRELAFCVAGNQLTLQDVPEDADDAVTPFVFTR